MLDWEVAVPVNSFRSDSPDKPHVWPEQWGGGLAISQPVWWPKSQDSSAFDIEQEFLRVHWKLDYPEQCAQLQHVGTSDN